MQRATNYHPQRRATELWWLKPGWIVLAAIVPVYVSFLAFDFSREVPTTYIPSPLYFWGLALLLILALGTTFGGQIDLARRHHVGVLVPRWVAWGLLLATLVGYAVWFHPLVLQPQLILDVIGGGRSNVRDQVKTIPPWTTMTQFGCAFAVAYAIRAGNGHTGLGERLGLAAVFLLALFRSVVWNERLAFIEVAACYTVAMLAYYRFSAPLTFRLASLLPVIAPLALYLVFTATEYFRSWEFYRQYYESIWQFSYDRLTAYYAVASNNGIGLLTESVRWPSYDGSYVFQWAYPRPEEDSSNFLRTVAQYDYKVFLENYARPELNNPSGIFVIVYDVGYLGSALYFLLVGVLIGIAYRAFRQGHLGGVLFYPTCVMFLIELLRFNYFAASRFVPIVAALVLILFSAHRRPVWRMPYYARGAS
ncbi:MAG TPA: O-antigen polymerase [Burkholderiaceae bacterium]|jgi:oligosaccharide repeat unit polymerase|nr:O-antigen polymerase [Burkholderiaceae bacterium]